VSRFVLVHGAFHGAWCWELVVSRLQSSGHAVVAIDLPGSGADDTPPGEVTLESCAERVAETVRDGEPAVLVGHGMGGVAITQAATIARDHIARLVYVCAFLPRDGESAQSLASTPEGDGDQIRAGMVVEGEQAVLPEDDARVACYGTSSPQRANWAVDRIGPQPLAPLRTPVSLGGGIDPIDRHYILAAEDRAIPPALQRKMAHDNPCREIAELGTDHAPFLSAPDELVALLERFARD
jgi:pimeloyl-ACP methyl ester carboxylesterase